MKTKAHDEKASRAQAPETPRISSERADATPEITLIAILLGLILLRVVDLCTTAPADPAACAPASANHAAISCTVRESPHWGRMIRPAPSR